MKDENVICVSLDAMKRQFDMSEQIWKASVDNINSLPYEYINRSVAENDFTHKQLIPYAVLLNQQGEVFCYQRHGSEKRLADVFSVGIGGHINDHDGGDTISQRLVNGLRREFMEEVGVELSENQFELAGMINEEETEVGHCHTGVVFKVLVDNVNFTFDAEIGNPQWKRIEDLDLAKFELWSALALKLLFSIPKIEI
jgi:predicted NUDIX family phosphoesterase